MPDKPTLKEIVNNKSSYLVKPMGPSGTPGKQGTAILVPDATYYYVHAYVSGEAGPTEVKIPKISGVLVVDLPRGGQTTAAEYQEFIDTGVGGGDPGSVGPDKPPTNPH